MLRTKNALSDVFTLIQSKKAYQFNRSINFSNLFQDEVETFILLVVFFDEFIFGSNHSFSSKLS
jgi:hypothetical protein